MINFYKKHNYYSYAMGISYNILKLRQQGFLIKKIGSDYFVSFPQEKRYTLGSIYRIKFKGKILERIYYRR